MKNKYLFLDDIRVPKDAFDYIKDEIYINKTWIIVRNFNEFIQYIIENGLPDLISFDHDLADEHYVPSKYWYDYEASKKYQEQQNNKEKTGFDCAKWLVDYCIDNDLKLPSYLSHSMNPVGRDNILGILDNFKKYEK